MTLKTITDLKIGDKLDLSQSHERPVIVTVTGINFEKNAVEIEYNENFIISASKYPVICERN